jgi:hypothetical protein
VLGKVRAKQDQHGATREDRTMVMPLLISGDAAFAGQGVIAECFGLSDLRGHRTGGSVHFIVNNQIGFTTYPRYSRSSPYPTDIAKMIEAPIFHANGDDPEAVVYAAKVATEFRQKFQKPVVIDMFCYRRFGHNEGDEPAFTQPLMYKAIRAHPTTLEIYSKRLIGEGVVELSAIRALHRLDLVGRHHAFGDQPVGVDLRHRRVLGDALVHERLGEGRLVRLVVAEAAIAEHVDDHRAAELLAELGRHLGGIDDRLGIVAVGMEDRRLDHLGDIGRVGR